MQRATVPRPRRVWQHNRLHAFFSYSRHGWCIRKTFESESARCTITTAVGNYSISSGCPISGHETLGIFARHTQQKKSTICPHGCSQQPRGCIRPPSFALIGVRKTVPVPPLLLMHVVRAVDMFSPCGERSKTPRPGTMTTHRFSLLDR